MRLENTVKNLFYGYISKGINILLNFIVRIIFLKYIAIEYLGASGLFSNIFGVLSFAELGIGEAITFCLYKPLLEDDHEKIKTLINFFKKCYFVVSTLVIVGGVVCIPFLGKLTNNSQLPNLILIYVMYLFDTVVTYYGAAKQSLLTADQMRYIVSCNTVIIQFIKSILQIIVIITTKQFLAYLFVQISCQLLTVIYLNYTANKYYPYLHEKDVQPLTVDEKNSIIENVKALFMQKIGSILVNNTDNLIVSSFLGLSTTGIVSNFTMIISSVNMLLLQLCNATIASVGNLNASSTSLDYKRKIFNRLDFLNYSLYMICTIYLVTLTKPLIEIIGKEFSLDDFTILVLSTNFMLSGTRQIVNQFKETSGLFVYDKYKGFCEALINLVASIILVIKMGIVGVYIGTFLCNFLGGAWWEQRVLFKHYFNESFIPYNLKWIGRLTLTVVSSVLLIALRNYLNLSGLACLLVMFFIDSFVIFVMYYIIYRTSEELTYYIGLFKDKVLPRVKRG